MGLGEVQQRAGRRSGTPQAPLLALLEACGEGRGEKGRPRGLREHPRWPRPRAGPTPRQETPHRRGPGCGLCSGAAAATAAGWPATQSPQLTHRQPSPRGHRHTPTAQTPVPDRRASETVPHACPPSPAAPQPVHTPAGSPPAPVTSGKSSDPWAPVSASAAIAWRPPCAHCPRLPPAPRMPILSRSAQPVRLPPWDAVSPPPDPGAQQAPAASHGPRHQQRPAAGPAASPVPAPRSVSLPGRQGQTCTAGLARARPPMGL